MKLSERKDCIHYEVCKYDDGMCPMECGHFAERSDNSDYAVPPTASPKLPSLEELKSYMHRNKYSPNIVGTYEAIKKLGNFA